MPRLDSHEKPKISGRMALRSQVKIGADGKYRFSQDFVFSSPATAAGVVLGRSANGRTEWKDEHGKTLKELQTVASESEEKEA